MRFIDTSDNIIYDTNKMELISSIQKTDSVTKLYKTVTNTYFIVQGVLLGCTKMYKLEEYEVREFLAEYDIDAYIRLFNPKEGE